MKRVNAFVLAAGLGERLRPITNHIPKPLLPILGKPVIGLILERLSLLPVEKICVNTHHIGTILERWLISSPYHQKIIIFNERDLLGTGGALLNAASVLGNGVFITHNADIVSDIDVNSLLKKHFESRNLATLAVHDRHPFNNVWIDPEGRLRHIGKEEPPMCKGLRCVAFTGVAAYSPDFIELLPPGFSSVTDAWLKAASGLGVGTADYTGCSWTDIGTPSAYADAVFKALIRDGETIYVDTEARCGDSAIGSRTVLEKGVTVSKGSRLRNCIILSGAHVKADTPVENAIMGPDFLIPLAPLRSSPTSLPAMFLSNFMDTNPPSLSIEHIGVGGSDRAYYRVSNKKITAVLMESPAEDPDFQRHVIYTQFFRKHSVPVPQLKGTDAQETFIPASPPPTRRYALFEDLGDLSLYSWLKCRPGPGRIEQLYQRVLDILVNLHTVATSKVSECPQLKSRVFDYDHLRWETNYFMERFVAGLLGMDVSAHHQVHLEFDLLARSVDAFPKTIVHRDFQSQNIMVTEGDIPRLIDYQGARLGPPAYDVVSLLWDPYTVPDESLQKHLLDAYCEAMSARAPAFEAKFFRRTLMGCRLQRHMQALGAYAYLSKVKGKTYFLKYVPPCLEYLNEEASHSRDHYPALFALVEEINEKT